MIPSLIAIAGAPWDVLPAGIHKATLEDVRVVFATNARRRELFDGLSQALMQLRFAGCPEVFLDGSYVTSKPHPGDFDACWNPSGVDYAKLDRVFLDFKNGRAAQKAAFKGEFFPSSMTCTDVGNSFLEFFKLERHTGEQKGIVSIALLADPFLMRKALP